MIKNLLLIFPIVLLISCSDVQEDTEICHIDPYGYEIFKDMTPEKFVESRISLFKCDRNDILVVEYYGRREFKKYYSNIIEEYCRFDREIITKKNSDNEIIEFKCVLNSSDRRVKSLGLD